MITQAGLTDVNPAEVTQGLIRKLDDTGSIQKFKRLSFDDHQKIHFNYFSQKPAKK